MSFSVYVICNAGLLVAVEGDDAYAFVVGSGAEYFFENFNYFFCLNYVFSVYPFTFNLASFYRTVLEVFGNITGRSSW